MAGAGDGAAAALRDAALLSGKGWTVARDPGSGWTVAREVCTFWIVWTVCCDDGVELPRPGISRSGGGKGPGARV